ncbi:hypothetical protein V502_03717 [Pseudogymnoascus sp. VKM F-4520 (FW-2644)]|nr:hypothetical protein V502_03717 [Pseudogymnoascus sp. VKM F-4520 (FW-2644)]
MSPDWSNPPILDSVTQNPSGSFLSPVPLPIHDDDDDEDESRRPTRSHSESIQPPSTAIMSQPSLAPFVLKRPFLKRWLTPFANWYANAAGYRKLGLRADDLIPEESDVVLQAIKRLPPKESYDRVFRLRRAFQCSLSHQLLPKEQQTPPEEVCATHPSPRQEEADRIQDYPYLSPIIQEIEAELKERNDLDSLVVKRR